jgi:hypothetical protein
MSHLLFLTGSGQTTAGHASRARDQAVVSVNPRMRGDIMAALHPIRVECPDGLRRVAQGLWSLAWGLICRALARGMISPGRAVWTVLPGSMAGCPDLQKATACWPT